MNVVFWAFPSSLITVLWKPLSVPAEQFIMQVCHAWHMYSRCLGRFSNYFAILNDVIMDILIHRYLFVCLVISLGQFPRGEISGLKIMNILRILRHSSRLFSKNSALLIISTPTKSLRASISILLPALGIILCF